jgi:hypothetical protein
MSESAQNILLGQLWVLKIEIEALVYQRLMPVRIRPSGQPEALQQTRRMYEDGRTVTAAIFHRDGVSNT